MSSSSLERITALKIQEERYGIENEKQKNITNNLCDFANLRCGTYRTWN